MFLTLREDFSVRVFQSKMLKNVFGLKREEVGQNYIMRIFIIFTLHIILWG
jgi:hypothetical protein